jgi:hypothetical protein
MVRGMGFLSKERHNQISRSPVRFAFARRVKAKDWLRVTPTQGSYAGRWDGRPDSWVVIVPLWLVTVVLVGVCWSLWRKTRGTGTGRGFPVEVENAAQELAGD